MTKIPNYAKIEKLETARCIVNLLNEKHWKITYAELAKILKLHPLELGRVLDLVNRQHKDAGGTEMITGCIVNITGEPGLGYALCAKELGLQA